jgi:hypothetical protein
MKNIVSYDSFVNESKLQNDYREFFSNVLKVYGVKSPAEFKSDQELGKKFYADIKKGWNNGEGISKYGEDLLKKLDEKEVKESLDEPIVEALDGEELLSAKQKKLPEGLKKGIIKKLKKSGKKAKDDDCDDKDCDDKKKKCDDKECDDDKKEKSGSDEEKYLTPKQRKLPEGLKKGIIARAKKKKSNEALVYDEDIDDLIDNEEHEENWEQEEREHDRATINNDEEYEDDETNTYTLPSEKWEDCISKFLEVANGFSEVTIDVISSNVVQLDCEDENMINDIIDEFEQINPEYITEYDPDECTVTIDEK